MTQLEYNFNNTSVVVEVVFCDIYAQKTKKLTVIMDTEWASTQLIIIVRDTVYVNLIMGELSMMILIIRTQNLV